MIVIDPDRHVSGCTMRLALTCAVAIECRHGYDVCPTCDPCTCEKERNRVKRGETGQEPACFDYGGPPPGKPGGWTP